MFKCISILIIFIISSSISSMEEKNLTQSSQSQVPTLRGIICRQSYFIDKYTEYTTKIPLREDYKHFYIAGILIRIHNACSNDEAIKIVNSLQKQVMLDETAAVKDALPYFIHNTRSDSNLTIAQSMLYAQSKNNYTLADFIHLALWDNPHVFYQVHPTIFTTLSSHFSPAFKKEVEKINNSIMEAPEGMLVERH